MAARPSALVECHNITFGQSLSQNTRRVTSNTIWFQKL